MHIPNKNVNHKEIQLYIDEKNAQNVQNSLMTIEEMPAVAILFFQMRPKYFLASFRNDEHILHI